MNEYWCIPPEDDADFVARMEDVLDVYEKPYDEKIPVVCMDEKSIAIGRCDSQHRLLDGGFKMTFSVATALSKIRDFWKSCKPLK